MGASVWLAITLWSIMCFGEIGFIDQSAMLILLWGLLFSLPPLYVASKRVLDALIDESLRFLISVANGGNPHLFRHRNVALFCLLELQVGFPT